MAEAAADINRDEHDFYRLLQVPKNATQKQIKDAYKKKSLQYHPDKNKGEKRAEEMMKLLNEAKETLLDSSLRADYDENHDGYDNWDDVPDDEKIFLSSERRLSQEFQVLVKRYKAEFGDIEIEDNFEIIDKMWAKLYQDIYKISTELESDVRFKTKPSLEPNYFLLKSLAYEYKHKDMAILLEAMKCPNTADKLYNELAQNHDLEKLPGPFKATLSLLKGAKLKYSNQLSDALDELQKVLFDCPADDSLTAVAILLNDVFVRANYADLLIKLMNDNLEAPDAHKFDQALKKTTFLRTVLKYEKNIRTSRDLSNFDKAMLYIDLNAAGGHPCSAANNYFLASYFLLLDMRKDETEHSLKYAYRNVISDIVSRMFFFIMNTMSPPVQLHFCRLSLKLLRESNVILRDATNIARGVPFLDKDLLKVVPIGQGKTKTKVKLMDLKRESQFVLANHFIEKVIRVTQVTNLPVLLSGDVIYMDLVADQFMNNFCKQMISQCPDHVWGHYHQYYLLEGSWKGWGDCDKFEEHRIDAMMSLLNKKDWNVEMVEKLMKWQVINREEGGWIDVTKPWLNLPGPNFDSVDGLVIDMETGGFEILMTESECGLFNLKDVEEVLSGNINAAFFSLDAPDTDFSYHPFQEMRYGPDSLEGTNYVQTLLHADYLLKMFSMGTDVSAEAPFLFRLPELGYMRHIPEFLQEKMQPIYKRRDRTNIGEVHRFWIDSYDIPLKQHHKNNQIAFTFGHVPMRVKKHLMRIDETGNLVDDDDSEEDEDASSDEEENDAPDEKKKKKKKRKSPEKQFADDMTAYYEEISCYFPVFARLKELLKLNAVVAILRRTKDGIEEEIKTLAVDKEPIKKMLSEIEKQVDYPVNTSSNCEKHFRQVLRDNGISNESHVASGECSRVRSDIRSQLAGVDRSILQKVTESIADALGIPNTSALYNKVKAWMESGFFSNLFFHEADTLTDHIAEELKNKKILVLNRFLNNLKKWKIDFDVEKPKKNPNECVWVPAAFKKHESNRIYGGVCMNPKLAAAGSVPSGGGRGGGGGSGPPGSSGGGGSNGNNDLINRVRNNLLNSKLVEDNKRIKADPFDNRYVNRTAQTGSFTERRYNPNRVGDPGKDWTTTYRDGGNYVHRHGYVNVNPNAKTLSAWKFPDDPVLKNVIHHVTEHSDKFVIHFSHTHQMVNVPRGTQAENFGQFMCIYRNIINSCKE